jgi:hypothetical protein
LSSGSWSWWAMERSTILNGGKLTISMAISIAILT